MLDPQKRSYSHHIKTLGNSSSIEWSEHLKGEAIMALRLMQTNMPEMLPSSTNLHEQPHWRRQQLAYAMLLFNPDGRKRWRLMRCPVH